MKVNKKSIGIKRIIYFSKPKRKNSLYSLAYAQPVLSEVHGSLRLEYVLDRSQGGSRDKSFFFSFIIRMIISINYIFNYQFIYLNFLSLSFLLNS